MGDVEGFVTLEGVGEGVVSWGELGLEAGCKESRPRDEHRCIQSLNQHSHGTAPPAVCFCWPVCLCGWFAACCVSLEWCASVLILCGPCSCSECMLPIKPGADLSPKDPAHSICSSSGVQHHLKPCLLFFFPDFWLLIWPLLLSVTLWT